MIKINLLPPRKRKALAAGQRHLLLIFLTILVECLILAWVYKERSGTLDAQDISNTTKKREVARLKEEIGDLDKLKTERTELQKQQEILDSLEKARSGPVHVLNEVAFLVSQAQSERLQKELLRRNLNTTWDPRRLTLASFVEEDRKVHITGFAKTNDDVAEFMKRLQSSSHFRDVQLNFTKTQEDKSSSTPVVTFDISCKISYTGAPGEEVPLFQTKQK